MNADLIASTCLLFVPGNRPDRFKKARDASPNGIIIDLEDAVSVDQKASARIETTKYMQDRAPGSPVFLRINPLTTKAGLGDLLSIARGELYPDGVVLPKVEAARDIAILRNHSGPSLSILAMIETARGIENVTAIGAALTQGDGLAFGGVDLATELGAAFSFEPLLAARSAIIRAAATFGLAAFDVPCLDTNDSKVLYEEAKRVRALGFTGKLSIHPAQVPVIATAFVPSSDEVEQAREMLKVYEQTGEEAISYRGRLIDAPVAAAARRILRRAV